MLLLDADTLSLAHAGHPQVSDRLRRADPNEIAIPVIVEIEILRGRQDAVLKAADGEQLLRSQQRLHLSRELLGALPIIPIDAAAAAEFDRLRANRQLRKIGRADLLIAAIALTHRTTLVTRNQRHFQLVPGLRLENWADD
jgi:tRNA(fMet)-specific endonuclease VapC